MSRILLYLGKFAHMVLGYLAASLAASAFLNMVFLGAAGLMAADSPPEVATGSMVFTIPFTALFVAYFAFVPAVVVMLLAELLGKRDWLFYASPAASWRWCSSASPTRAATKASLTATRCCRSRSLAAAWSGASPT